MAAPSQNLNNLLVTVGAVVPPTTITSSKTLSSNMAALGNLDRRQLLGCAIGAWSVIVAQSGAGPASYLLNYPNIVRDAQTFMGGFPTCGFDSAPNLFMLQMEAALVMQQAGKSIFSATVLNVNTLLDNTKNLQGYTETQLWQMLMFLRYCFSTVNI